MEQRLRFTFDVDKAIKNIENRTINYSENICDINYDRLITQKEIYNSISSNSPGFCVLTSIYNAFESIFKNFNEFINFVKEQLEKNHKYYSLQCMTNEINKYKNQKLLFDEQNLQESYKIYTKNISQNKPVVISYGFQTNNILIPKFGQHAVSLFGYNDNFIYYHENSEDEYLFTSLALYIYHYYKINGVSKDNLFYDKINKMLNSKTNEEVYETSKSILGYNQGRNNIRTLKKEFLTNNKYFYDINRMITYKEDIPRYIPEDNCSEQYNYSFNNLTDRSNKINF